MVTSPSSSPTTRETVAFITSALEPLGEPASAARILEVGCGAGEVARELARKGLQVTAIDASPEAVAKARANGVPAVEADFLRYERGDEEPFDAVVFTRSLHHIAPLDEAMRRAYEAMRPGGLFIAEEFALESIDRPTARWLYALEGILESTGALSHDHCAQGHHHGAHGHHHGARERPADPLERWMADHSDEHQLHQGEVMLTAVHQLFELVEVSLSPYLYRTLGGRLEPGERGDHLRQLLFEWESASIAEGSLRAVGLRFVAQRPDPSAPAAS